MKYLLILMAFLLGSDMMADTIQLPGPEKTGGMPLAEALASRKSTRRYANAKSPTLQDLSNLLWAANGVTRPNGKRTAPSAMNRQEIQLSVATAEGLFTYDAKANTLTSIESKDDLANLRGDASIYVILHYDTDIQARESALTDAGFVGQNIYLWCASEGWGVCFFGTVDRKRVAAALGLKPEAILFAQKVGITSAER